MRNIITMGGLATVVEHKLQLSGQPSDRAMRIVLLADLHVCEPWMPLGALRRIIQQVDAIKPDLILLLGDYLASRKLPCRWVPITLVADNLATLSAPLGVFAVQGNHDWWDDPKAQETRSGPTQTETAFRAADIRLLQNEATRLVFDHTPIWVAGVESQWAFGKTSGLDDIAKTIAGIKQNEPILLMAHEPDIFHDLPDQVDLTVSGHTHAGQLNLLGYRPLTPSKFGARYAYGHHKRNLRQLVVSGGIGYSGLPLRIGAPPEITVLNVRFR